jgi:hypothetical protein
MFQEGDLIPKIPLVLWVWVIGIRYPLVVETVRFG